MTAYDRAVRAVVRRLPGVDEGGRAEIAGTLESLAGERGAERWRELGSLVTLRVSLRSRGDTGNAPERSWLQGLHRGGAVLLAASAVQAVASAPAHDDGVAMAVVLVAATWAAVTGRRASALTLLAASAFLVAAADVVASGPLVTRLVVAALALAIGGAPERELGRLCPWQWMGMVAAASGVVLMAPRAEAVVVGAVLTGGIPAVWLLASRADPRLAVGAATVFFWRLVAVDLHQLGEAAMAVPAGRELDLLLLRWVLMGLGVAAAVMVAHVTIRRSTSL